MQQQTQKKILCTWSQLIKAIQDFGSIDEHDADIIYAEETKAQKEANLPRGI